MSSAERYLNSQPDTKQLIKPEVFAQIGSLLLAAHQMTQQPVYVERARYVGDLGMSLFLDQTSGLPKASNQHHHYEAITGGPDFMAFLLERLKFLR